MSISTRKYSIWALSELCRAYVQKCFNVLISTLEIQGLDLKAVSGVTTDGASVMTAMGKETTEISFKLLVFNHNLLILRLLRGCEVVRNEARNERK